MIDQSEIQLRMFIRAYSAFLIYPKLMFQDVTARLHPHMLLHCLIHLGEAQYLALAELPQETAGGLACATIDTSAISIIDTELEASTSSAPPKELSPQNCKKQELEKSQRKKKVTHDDILRVQYDALVCKKETLELKKLKLELQVKLLEKQLSA